MSSCWVPGEEISVLRMQMGDVVLVETEPDVKIPVEIIFCMGWGLVHNFMDYTAVRRDTEERVIVSFNVDDQVTKAVFVP